MRMKREPTSYSRRKKGKKKATKESNKLRNIIHKKKRESLKAW